jgi:hypothetical protein
MRRWYIGSAIIGSLALAAIVGPRLLSTNAQEAAAQPAAANQQTSVNAKSRIDKVTVYPNSALITREVEVPAGNGLIELVINPAPAQIVPSTMYSEAGDGLRVLTTRFSTRVVAEDTSADRRKLESEKEELMVVAARINSEIASVTKNMELLGKLENVTEKGKDHTGDEIISLSKYVMTERVAKAKDLVVLKEQARQNNIKLDYAERRLQSLGAGSGREEREVIIVVDRDNSKGGTIRLNYLVGAVTWRPEYKLRAGKVNEDVQVEYLANLQQATGESWDHVKMTLSTAQPMLNASPPELSMLQPVLMNRGVVGGGGSPFLAGEGKELQMKAAELRSQAAGNYRGGKSDAQKDAAKQLNDAAAWEQNFDLMRDRAEVLAEAKKKQPTSLTADGPSVTYHLPNRLSVPNRHDEQVIEIVKLKLTPKYYYKAVPVLNRHVYRLADLVNKSSHEFLPGEATMYQGSDFVGRMPMPLVAIGEEFTAGFGVDTQLQISRQMVDQTRSTQGGNQVLKYDYRILISSYKSEPVKLQLWDRLPKATEAESVNVILGKVSPDLCSDGLYLRESRPNNLLRWDVEVPANCNGEKAFAVTYDFRMELDRQMAITGFQSR